MRPVRDESIGVMKWISDEYGLEARAWISPERAYQKVRTIGERLGLHVYDHWFRSQRASMLTKYYRFNERLLSRFFTWAGSWERSGKSQAALYARTGKEELMQEMTENRSRLDKELEVKQKNE